MNRVRNDGSSLGGDLERDQEDEAPRPSVLEGRGFCSSVPHLTHRKSNQEPALEKRQGRGTHKLRIAAPCGPTAMVFSVREAHSKNTKGWGPGGAALN